MKNFITILGIGLCLMACNEAEPKSEDSVNSSVKLSETDKNFHYEYYPNGQVKVEGPLDSDGLKMGEWHAYFENGNKLSSSTYVKGINNGYSIVWYPNGNVRYFGDYKNGKKTGKWSFYSEDGTLFEEKTY